MPLNAQFFAAIRSSMYAGHIPQSAVDNYNTVCTVFDRFTGHDHCPDDLAAILATIVIETGKDTDLTIEEYGRGRGKEYGKPAGPYNLIYYGRGPCQVTWLANYQKAKTRTNIDYVAHPELMCDPNYGVMYMIDAMYGGVFTGFGLRNYITPGKVTTYNAFKEARKIINGQDKADEYANYCLAFSNALKVGYDAPLTSGIGTTAKPMPAPPPTAVVQPERKGLIWDILRLFGRK